MYVFTDNGYSIDKSVCIILLLAPPVVYSLAFSKFSPYCHYSRCPSHWFMAYFACVLVEPTRSAPTYTTGNVFIQRVQSRKAP